MIRAYSLRRIGIASAVTRLALALAIFGFIIGLAAAFWAAVLAASFTLLTGIDLTGAGYRLLVLFPVMGMIIMAVCGAVTVFLVVLLYNLIAGRFGGIAVELEEEIIAQHPDEQIIPAHSGSADDSSVPL